MAIMYRETRMDARTDKKQVLFVQGGGNGGYEVDAKLAASLQEALGTAYHVRYPRMPTGSGERIRGINRAGQNKRIFVEFRDNEARL